MPKFKKAITPNELQRLLNENIEVEAAYKKTNNVSYILVYQNVDFILPFSLCHFGHNANYKHREKVKVRIKSIAKGSKKRLIVTVTNK